MRHVSHGKMRFAAGAAAITMLAAACAPNDVTAEGEPASDAVDSESSDDAPESDPEDDPEPDPDPVEDAEGDEAEDEPEAAREDLEIVDSGFSLYESYDDSTRASWGVLISNPNDAYIATSVDVTITFLDDTEGVIGSTSESIAALLPGQTAALADSTYEDASGLADLRVQVRARDWEEPDGEVGSFESSGVNVRPAEYGGWTVAGSVTSTFVEDFEDVYATAILRNADDAIVGGAWTFIDFVPAGGDTSVQIDVLDEIGDVESADVHFQLSNLSLW